MESFLNSQWGIYLVLFLMLLGAFLIGYLFGNQKDEKQVVNDKVKQVVAQVREVERKLDRVEKRVEISDLSEPGQVRAMKTRDRTGKLSDDAKTEIVESVLDLEFIGKGNPSRPDDFQKIVGIGPFVEEKLKSIGINSYEQLSKLRDQDTEAITMLIEFFPGRIHRDDWKGQAAALLKLKNKEK
ncbi:MAG: hypothetical protein ABJN73_03360 [Nonlabens ulvanivorans]|uniref:hypothetical protein n=1 Tax=Nonlabens ulvanivorans TaxID=906888 RepID=UPI0029434478|nr:hypothetical protein [Nonlabens ulvanivorans]WOI23523.1 hypothetical protein R1T42_03510 [Nonlabens ulvanivorans]